MYTRRRLRIYLREPSMERRPPHTPRIGIEASTHIGIGGRQRRQALLQRSEVQHGAARQQWDAPARRDGLHLSVRFRSYLRRRIGRGWFLVGVLSLRGVGLFVGGGFGRSDFHPGFLLGRV